MSGLDRPILFHRMFGNYSRTVTPRLSLSASFSMGYGMLDYNSFMTYISLDSTSMPRTGITTVAAVAASVGLSYQLTQRLALGMGVNASKREAMNQSSSSGLGGSQSLSVSCNTGYRISERTSVAATLTGSQAETALGTTIRSGSAQTSLGHTFSPTSSANIGVGVSVFAPAGRDLAWYPMGSASFSHVGGKRGRRITWTAATVASAFVDTILSRVRSNATFTGSVSAELGSHWTGQASVGTMLPTSTRPVGNRTAESYAQGTVSLARPIGNHAEFSTGIRHSLRMTHPNATPFDILDRQTWVFAAFSVWLATEDGTNGRWVL